MSTLENELRKLKKDELIRVLKYTVENTAGGLVVASRMLNIVMMEREEVYEKEAARLYGEYHRKTEAYMRILSLHEDASCERISDDVRMQMDRMEREMLVARTDLEKYCSKHFGGKNL